MKYAIYGINRVTKDFLYMFEDLNIICFFEDEVNEAEYLEKPVFDLKDITVKRGEFDKLILCDFDKTKKEKKMKMHNFLYEKDYLYEKDFFELLNEKNEKINPEQKKVVVWGTGQKAKILLEYQKDLEVEFFIDSYKKEDYFWGISVFKPDEVNDLNDYFIILALAKEEEPEKFLTAIGLQRYADYCSSNDYMTLPSRLLEKTIFDTNCYDIHCKSMLNHCEINPRGDLYCCCISFLSHSMGNVNRESYQEIWNSNIHKIMCLSLENRTYSFCKKEMCPLFIGKQSESKVFLSKAYSRMEDCAKTLAIGFDESCNLSCVTCRKNVIVLKDEELERRKRYAQVAKEEMAPGAEFIVMAGAGEVFCGPLYKDFYMDDSLNQTKWIRLLSNGTLFNKKRWDEFTANKIAKIMLTVSIDAASKETYEYIRKNGNFDVLKQNMEFAASLRKTKALSYFRLNFVVQKKNYKEMIPFIEWGLELGVDEIFFTKIRNWGTYTKEEFKEISMMEEDGVTPKKELMEILDHPIMKNPIVDLGTIRYAHEPVKEKYIENYYRWELERKVPDLFV